jgi:hypothetical protein
MRKSRASQMHSKRKIKKICISNLRLFIDMLRTQTHELSTIEIRLHQAEEAKVNDIGVAITKKYL